MGEVNRVPVFTDMVSAIPAYWALIDLEGHVFSAFLLAQGLHVALGGCMRAADGAIQARSIHAVENLLPEAAAAVEDSLANLSVPTPMQVGRGWCENRTLISSGRAGSPSTVEELSVEIVRPYE